MGTLKLRHSSKSFTVGTNSRDVSSRVHAPYLVSWRDVRKQEQQIETLSLPPPQSLRSAREVAPSPLPAVGVTLTANLNEHGGGDANQVSPPVASTPPGGGVGSPGARSGKAGVGHPVDKLEARAAEIMDEVVGLRTFCQRAGAPASKDLQVIQMRIFVRLVNFRSLYVCCWWWWW